MAATRAKKSRRSKSVPTVERSTPPLMFLPEQPRSFAYVEDEDEFEIPQVPSEFARQGRQVSVAVAFQPASSFDLIPTA